MLAHVTWAWWYMSGISVLGGLKQEDYGSRLVWVTVLKDWGLLSARVTTLHMSGLGSGLSITKALERKFL